jgi:hypothetical protein
MSYVAYPCNGILFGHKKDGVLLHATIQVNLENIISREISQAQKDRYYMIPSI